MEGLDPFFYSKTNEIYFFNKLYITREDKEWGLTDCYSSHIMEENEITKALTADIHFKQFGMDILLK